MDDTEQQIARLRQIEAMKPRKGAILLVIPIVAVILVGVTYIGMYAMFLQGRAADGERVTMAWSTCAEAQPVLEKRVEAMGLGDPELTFADGTLTLVATLPAEEDVAARIPGTLAMTGLLEGRRIEAPDDVLLSNTHITDAAMRQDLTLMPWTVLTLTDAGVERLKSAVVDQRDGKVRYTLDGVEIGVVSNLKGPTREVELTPDGPTERDRMHAAAERTIVLGSGPLPCPLTALGPT